MSATVPPIGALTERVQYQRRDTAIEDEGGHATTYLPIATLWARVTAIGARAGANADASGSTLSHSVVLRFRTDVKPGDRIVYRGRKLDVLSAEDISGGKRYLGCRCSEVAVSG